MDARASGLVSKNSRNRSRRVFATSIGSQGYLAAGLQWDFNRSGLLNRGSSIDDNLLSLLAGNVSSGIERVFELQYRRRVLNQSGDYETYEVTDYAFHQWREMKDQALPDYFVDACSLSPGAHLRMQAALQPFVDNAISKTINVPEDYALEAFISLYESAYRNGVKGCTTFRPTPAREGILLSGKQDRTEQGVPNAHCCSIEREED